MGRKKEGDIIVGQIGGEGLLWRENMVGGARAWHVPGAPQHGDPALVRDYSLRWVGVVCVCVSVCLSVPTFFHVSRWDNF